ncbi:DSBA oxidoreductase [Seminavis robusta]|uniref:DSBA oxidoreductase n=1 Tax=Seminavis robusta TaxID=568900 RepID=A0A9N8EKL5_9STRA|nr:DSBA oxidoreductase [Seminavis robusta]|eukprot:Sro1153_g247000.1 DSBA oxidoreductase (156) ;mRNA; r:13272-13833
MASHRLIQYLGKTFGLAVSEAIYDKLNEYYFVQGHSLNDRPQLAKTVSEELTKLLADKAPSESELLTFLNGNEGRKEIETALQQLQMLGVHGIPKFIIGGNLVVDGAARSDVFVRVFREIERAGEVEARPIFGDILGIPHDIIEQGSHHPADMAA